MNEALKIKRKHEALDMLNLRGDDDLGAMLRELAPHMEANVRQRREKEEQQLRRRKARLGHCLARQQARPWRACG